MKHECDFHHGFRSIWAPVWVPRHHLCEVYVSSAPTQRPHKNRCEVHVSTRAMPHHHLCKAHVSTLCEVHSCCLSCGHPATFPSFSERDGALPDSLVSLTAVSLSPPPLVAAATVAGVHRGGCHGRNCAHMSATAARHCGSRRGAHNAQPIGPVAEADHVTVTVAWIWTPDAGVCLFSPVGLAVRSAQCCLFH